MKPNPIDNSTLQSKIRGSLIGGAIGDALGYQIEFDDNIRDKQVTMFRNGIGLISDDTQMTLFTANALLWRHTRWCIKGIAMRNEEAVYHGYLDWYKTQTFKGDNGAASLIKEVWLKTDHIKNHEQICWLTDVQDLHKRQAPGNTCLTSLRSGKMGTIDRPINTSKGCGGIMRIAPCGLINRVPDASGLLAARCAAVTHGHPLSHLASYMCAALISILTYQNTTLEEAVQEAFSLVKEHYKDFKVSDDNLKAFVTMMEKAIELSHTETKSDAATIKSIGGGWTAEDALAIAIYACLKYKSFEDIIICAANQDGDSDSTAAIAGNIIGAYLGVEAIPEYYIEHVELRDTILEVADDLCTALTDDYFERDANWQKKYFM